MCELRDRIYVRCEPEPKHTEWHTQSVQSLSEAKANPKLPPSPKRSQQQLLHCTLHVLPLLRLRLAGAPPTPVLPTPR